MTTSCSPQQGEIYLAYLEFSDKPGVGKVRPVLILENEEKQLVVTVAKVTSVSSGEVNSRFELKNWQDYGLLKPSFVRYDQRFRVSIDKILNDKPLGKLEIELFKAITEAIKKTCNDI
jgi:mRNA interferase MazF